MSPKADRPNILVFIPHDLGDHLGCYDHRTVKSPNIDHMAEEGVRFTNYFTAAAECTPSRAGMMTGLYTHQTGLMGLTHRGWDFNPGVLHLAKRLEQEGYDTHLFGFQHETGRSPHDLGYKHLHCQKAFGAQTVCGELREFLRNASARRDQPWFAYVGFIDVHRPWKDESSFKPQDVEVPPFLPDNPAVRLDLARFHQNILDMDQAVGTVLDTLRQTGLSEQTLTVFTTDHGMPFPRAKSTFYDPGIRIPLILHRPGHFQAGRVSDALLSNLDFTPTMLDYCGGPVPDGLEGRSFHNLLETGPYKDRDAVFGALYYDSFYDPMCYVRTKSHKYIRSFAVTPEDAAGADPEILARHRTGTWIRADDSDVQDSLSWKSMRDQTYPMPPREELYDLTADPWEQNNRVDDPSLGPILADMRQRLLDMMRRTKCPLLTGHVSPDLSRSRNQYCPA